MIKGSRMIHVQGFSPKSALRQPSFSDHTSFSVFRSQRGDESSQMCTNTSSGRARNFQAVFILKAFKETVERSSSGRSSRTRSETRKVGGRSRAHLSVHEEKVDLVEENEVMVHSEK